MSAVRRPPLGRVWHLAWPIILSNVTTPLLGIVDTAVVGRLPGPEYIAAVSIGAIAFTSIFWLFGFLRMGTSGFAAQASGAEDKPEILAVLSRAVLLGLALGLVMAMLQAPLWHYAALLLEPPPAVEPMAAAYFQIRIWAAPATLVNYAILGWLIGLQRTRTALVLQIWLNGVNIVLDIVFVMGLGMGVPGVAWATLIGECSAAVLGLIVAWRILRPDSATWAAARIMDRKRLTAFFTANLDIMIRTACLIFSFVWFARLGAQFGALTLAANAVLLQMVHLLAYGLDGFAFAAEALVGSALGKRRLDELRAAVTASTILAVVVAVGFALAYLVAGPLIIAAMTDQPETRAAAETYLIWVVVYPLVAVWCFQLDGIFIGATQTAEMRNAMIASLAVYMIAANTLAPVWGNHGLWAAITILNVARSASMALYYRRVERRALPERAPTPAA
ncbi:MAG: MATE family efflux transporter [Minwuia sp.]|uniref:MATE family efflux transporter n=1 Tax=Minwuia sp. TaxID=2493630 RepID=UPI003A8A5886